MVDRGLRSQAFHLMRKLKVKKNAESGHTALRVMRHYYISGTAADGEANFKASAGGKGEQMHVVEGRIRADSEACLDVG